MTKPIWERIEEERDGMEPEDPFWFNRFDRYYRPLGPERSILEAYRLWLEEKGRANARTAKKAPDTWYTTAEEYRWKYRAEAWDEVMRQERLAQELASIREMNDRHLTLVRGVLQMASRRLYQMLDAKAWEGLSFSDVLRYIEVGVRQERLLRGLPTEAIEMMALSDDDLLRRYHDLIEQVAAVSTDGTGDGPQGA